MSVATLELNLGTIQPRRERKLVDAYGAGLPRPEQAPLSRPFDPSSIIKEAVAYQYVVKDLSSGKETINDFDAVAVVLRPPRNIPSQNPTDIAERSFTVGNRVTNIATEFAPHVERLVSDATTEREAQSTRTDSQRPATESLNQLFLQTLAETSAGLEYDSEAIHRIVSFFTSHTDYKSRLRATTALLTVEMRGRDKKEEDRLHPPYTNTRLTRSTLEKQASTNALAKAALTYAENYGGNPTVIFTDMVNHNLRQSRRGKIRKPSQDQQQRHEQPPFEPYSGDHLSRARLEKQASTNPLAKDALTIAKGFGGDPVEAFTYLVNRRLNRESTKSTNNS